MGVGSIWVHSLRTPKQPLSSDWIGAGVGSGGKGSGDIHCAPETDALYISCFIFNTSASLEEHRRESRTSFTNAQDCRNKAGRYF